MSAHAEVFDPRHGWDRDVGELGVLAPNSGDGAASIVGSRTALEALRAAIDRVLEGEAGVGFQVDHGYGHHQLLVVAESDRAAAHVIDRWTEQGVARAVAGLQTA